MKRRTLKQHLALALAATVLLLILAMAAVAAAGLHDELGHSDVALVLGSKVEPDGTPSPRLRARLDQTLELYRAGYFQAVIASGGVGKEGYDEAVVMKDYLVAHGIPAARVILDGHGDTTFDSARNTRRIALEQNFKSVLVVSQYFHLPRARLALERFHMAPVYSAHARYFEFRDVYSILREVVGYPSYLWRSYD